LLFVVPYAVISLLIGNAIVPGQLGDSVLSLMFIFWFAVIGRRLQRLPRRDPV
jgi:hypothetical protein